MFCRLYRAASRKWGPQGLTLSAFAFKHAQETGDVFWRDLIDAVAEFFGDYRHCESSFRRERGRE